MTKRHCPECERLREDLVNAKILYDVCLQGEISLIKRANETLKAKLTQVREALVRFGCVRPWIPGSWAVVTNGPTCKNVWPRERWCGICVALAVIDAGKGGMT